MPLTTSRNARFLFRPIAFVFIILILFACTPVDVEMEQQTHSELSAPTTQPAPTAATIPNLSDKSLMELVLPVSVFVVDGETEPLSSQRTIEEVGSIYQRVNAIWAQANIRLNVQTIEHAIVPDELLTGIAGGDFSSFFNAVNTGQVVLPNLSVITGFYVHDLGGPNGINPASSNVFFVMDMPSVHDERVTSHEIGHILGLHHVRDDPDRLLFSGTNGTELDAEEIVVARYVAQGLLNGVR
jgi:hypothetical protein